MVVQLKYMFNSFHVRSWLEAARASLFLLPCPSLFLGLFKSFLRTFTLRFSSMHMPFLSGSHLQERFDCKDQKISENFYVRGDGTVSYNIFMLICFLVQSLFNLDASTLVSVLSTSLMSFLQVRLKKMDFMLKNSVCAANKSRTDQGI